MPTAPECPRCGYDLAGQIAAWHPNGDSLDGANCPTQSTCSECGLTFEWRYLLRPELIELRWFVETPRPPRAKRTYWRTWWHALRPWHFWQQVRMETTFNRPRLDKLAEAPVQVGGQHLRGWCARSRVRVGCCCMIYVYVLYDGVF